MVKVSGSHPDPPHTVGFLWASDQPVAQTFTREDITHTGDRYPCPGGIRTRNSSNRVAADPSLRRQSQRDRLTNSWIQALS